MGVPVIVSDIPGPTDAIIKNKTGIVVQKQNVNALYNSMLLIGKDNDLRENMSYEAINFVTEKFDKEKLKKFILQDRNKLIEKFCK